jgi:hypothetical protein
MLLRQRTAGGFRPTGSNGVLSLPLMQVLVWWSRKRVTLWKPDAVRVTAGSEHLATYQKTPISQRQYCTKCGGHVMTSHPTLGLIDVFSATLPTLDFTPSVHVNYAETVLPMHDGLPKLKDFPKEFGGTGETMPE